MLVVDNAVAPGYFSTFGVPFVAGRDFTRAARSASPSAIVTRQLADTLWPHESALGKILLTGPADRPARAEIIGVVENAYFSGRGSEGPPRSSSSRALTGRWVLVKRPSTSAIILVSR